MTYINNIRTTRSKKANNTFLKFENYQQAF